MSTAHVTKFAEIVAKDPALLARLGLDQVSDEASGRIFVTNAVKEAKAVGLEFTEGEGYEWMKREAASAGNGELSDTQLEAVAGGKGAAPAKDWSAVTGVRGGEFKAAIDSAAGGKAWTLPKPPVGAGGKPVDIETFWTQW